MSWTIWSCILWADNDNLLVYREAKKCCLPGDVSDCHNITDDIPDAYS